LWLLVLVIFNFLYLIFNIITGRGAVWLARLNGVQEVAGSNPVAPTDKKKKEVRQIYPGFKMRFHFKVGRWRVVGD
jgi:hypothetical protein